MSTQSQANGLSPPLIIYGNGAMARVYASYFSSLYTVVAFTVARQYCLEQSYCGLPLYPFDELTRFIDPTQHHMVIAVGYTHMNQVRSEIAESAGGMGFPLASYIAPDLIPHTGVTVGQHSIVLDKCSLHCDSTIGDNTFISSGVHIGHDCAIGNNVWINSGVALAGGVRIGDNCFLGVNASVAHNVVLAPGTFVGANTLVTENTNDYQVVANAGGEVYPVDSRLYLTMMESSPC